MTTDNTSERAALTAKQLSALHRETDRARAFEWLRAQALAGVSEAGVAFDTWAGLAARAASVPADPGITLAWSSDEQWVRDQLEIMIRSSRVLVDGDGTVTSYQIKTGALHKLIGRFAVTVPLGLPEVQPPAPAEMRLTAEQFFDLGQKHKLSSVAVRDILADAEALSSAPDAALTTQPLPEQLMESAQRLRQMIGPPNMLQEQWRVDIRNLLDYVEGK